MLCVLGGEIVFLPMRSSLTTAREKAIDSEGEKGSSGDRRERRGNREMDYVQQISINGIAVVVVGGGRNNEEMRTDTPFPQALTPSFTPLQTASSYSSYLCHVMSCVRTESV